MKEQHTSTSINTEIEHKKWFLKHYGLQEKSNATLYKESYEEMMKKYAPFVTTAATLTFKTSDIIDLKRKRKKMKRQVFKNLKIKNTLEERLKLKETKEKEKNTRPRFKFRSRLNDDKIRSSINYFTKRINSYCFGNKTKHKNKRDEYKLLILFFVEGDGLWVHKHIHLAIGNVPEELREDFEQVISGIWKECDFSNTQKDVRPTYDAQGWLNYDVKEVETKKNTDVFQVVESCIPRSIENRVCT